MSGARPGPEAGQDGPSRCQKVGLALLATYPLAVGAKPRTALARHNLVADEGQGSHKCTGAARLTWASGEKAKTRTSARACRSCSDARATWLE